jgi:hypothetical protein
MTTPPAGPAPAAAPPAGGAGGALLRRVLSWTGVVLVCFGVVASTLAVWVHRVVLNSDAFVATVRPVLRDPAVSAALGDAAASAAVEVLGVQQRLADGLPGASSFVAAPLTAAVTGAIERAIGGALAGESFQRAWEAALRSAHARTVAVLRGDSRAVGPGEDDALVLDVTVLVGAVLRDLQRSMPGLIPAGVSLPEPGGETPAQGRARLAAALGRPLPPDFGQIVLARGPAVARAQRGVRLLDAGALGLPLATLLLGALTVWLAPDRRRAAAAIGLGSAGALLAMAVAARLGGPPLLAGAAQGPLGLALGVAALGALLDSFSAVAAPVVFAGAALALAALFAARRRGSGGSAPAGGRGAAPPGSPPL